MIRKRKILYIAVSRFPTEKAHGYQVVKMCEAFSYNNEVLLLYPKRKNIKSLSGVKNIYEYYSIKKSFSMKKLFCFNFPILKNSGMKSLWFLTYSLIFAFSTLFWISLKKNNFDIIYSRSPFNLYFISILKRNINSKLIYETHNFPKRNRKFKIKLAKKVDKIVVVTQKIKELYVKAGVDHNKVIVEPDAVDLEQFNISLEKKDARKRLNIPQSIKMLSFIGQFHTMEMEKGIPEIIQSARYLINEFPAIRFYFVGGPLDREKKYQQLIDKIDLPPERFVFLGKQPVKDVPYWLKASDILLMPHPKNDYFSYYVSPLKMFEYMASKRPIVASKLPAIEEILIDGKNALMGKPGDPECIARNIRTVLLNPQLGKKLAENAYEVVQNYSWEKRAERILERISQ